MDKKVYIIGAGMDAAATLTAEARAAIEDADTLIGAARVLEPFRRLAKPMLTSFSADETAGLIAGSEGKSFAVLMSGDCGFFSGARRLLPLLGNFSVKVIPGISAPIYLCAKLKMPWQDLSFVSLHGREAPVVRPVCAHGKTFFLLGGKVTPSDICQRLTEYGLGALTVHVGENLALDGERIVSAAARELTDLKTGPLCAVIVENPDFERGLPACIPDGSFIRGKTPMTKAEVRCVCVAGLNVERGSVCWDVGAGTGSVSVELALRCGEGQVFAVERDPEAMALIEQNRKKFGCDNITPVLGSAPEALRALPAPDRVFIGGSGGRLTEIAAAIKAKNPAALVTATAVSLQTLAELPRLFADWCEITQLAVTRTKSVGTNTVLSAENPIFAVKGRLR